ncbi:MAG: hypothetical protein EXS36_18960 [Pedosphaera sp.]|nr:hypothetical protein [Pedosphaera sp.]
MLPGWVNQNEFPSNLPSRRSWITCGWSSSAIPPSSSGATISSSSIITSTTPLSSANICATPSAIAASGWRWHSWSATALHLRDRDQFIGWTHEQCRRRRALIANNANILLYTYCSESPYHIGARTFLEELSRRDDVALSEFILTD